MIYTSRYANPALNGRRYVVVGISKSLPKYPLKYPVSGQILLLAPGWNLMKECNRDIFEKGYRKQLNSIGAERILGEIKKFEYPGNDLVLCCFEDIRNPELFCHRTVFAEWWAEQTGEIIPELHDPSTDKWIKLKKKEKAKEDELNEEYVQMTFSW